MSAAIPALRPARGRASPGPRRFRGYAFGLDLDCPFPLPVAASSGTDRTLRIAAATPHELAAAWRPGEARSLVDRRTPAGALVMAIDRHEELGYHVWAPRHGRHLVSADGLRARSALPNVAPWRWQRLLFAQVLPLAAALQGLEPFHASAVALDGRVFAFIAPSGTGKSSIAAHLVGRGGSFVTDDVLALERADGGLRAHPGSGIAGVERRELRSIPAAGRARLGTVLGHSDKALLAVDLVKAPLPLGAIYFLRRTRGAQELRVERSPADPSLLLASAFLSYLGTPERMANQLDVCFAIAESVPVFTVELPSSVAASAAAAAIEAHATAIE